MQIFLKCSILGVKKAERDDETKKCAETVCNKNDKQSRKELARFA